MIHHISFYDPEGYPLSQYIINKIKTVECRKNSPTYQKIREGDTLILHDTKVDIECLVTYIHKYDSVYDYLTSETLEKALPHTSTIEEGLCIYRKFVDDDEIQSLKNQYKYGFLGIGIDVIKYAVKT